MSEKRVDSAEKPGDGQLSTQAWDRFYAEGRSLLVWPDEMFVRELNQLKDTEGLKALDIGCGAGRHTLLMAERGMHVKGIDSSSASIAFATQRAADKGLSNVTFVSIPLQELDDPDGSYDVIVIWGVVHYLSDEDQKAILSRIFSLLKPGGKLFATLRSTRDSRCDPTQRVAENRYKAIYFDAGEASEKEMVMSFWNEDEVRSLLSDYQSVTLGHRDLEPISENRLSTSHWLIRAQK